MCQTDFQDKKQRAIAITVAVTFAADCVRQLLLGQSLGQVFQLLPATLANCQLSQHVECVAVNLSFRGSFLSDSHLAGVERCSISIFLFLSILLVTHRETAKNVKRERER